MEWDLSMAEPGEGAQVNRIFKVGITRDFLSPEGELTVGDIGLDVLDRATGLKYDFLAEDTRELRADQVRDYDALLVLGPSVTAITLQDVDRLAVIARFGVGYDEVNVEACTHHDVALTITPDGVRRPLAAAAMMFILALSHKLMMKDRRTRAGQWWDLTPDFVGMGVSGRVLGVVGLGNVGRELLMLAQPFGMHHIAYDPYVGAEAAAGAGAELMPLDALMSTADFVCVCCPLTAETRALIDAERIGLMKPTSYLINVARGPIVDQQALTAALREQCIQGAALDVFEEEPIDAHDPLLSLDNVILSPHGICWTDELIRGNGVEACTSIVEVAAGRVPRHVVNRCVLSQRGFQEKLRRYAAQRRV